MEGVNMSLNSLRQIKEKARKYDEMLPLVEYATERAKRWDRVQEAYEFDKERGCSFSDTIKTIECILRGEHEYL
jgi:bisphosphoglycerate-independent phosphoglycerate mutase (AlkP superfamily)